MHVMPYIEDLAGGGVGTRGNRSDVCRYGPSMRARHQRGAFLFSKKV